MLYRSVMLLFSMALVPLITSCGQGPKTPANIKVTKAFSINASTSGMMLYLQNLNTGLTQSIRILNPGKTVDLSPGNWKFSVVGWDGANAFAGNLLCGKTSAVVGNTALTVNITINAANCDDDVFSPPAYRTAGVTNSLRLINCLNFSGVTAAGTTCNSTQKGSIGSYIVRMAEYSSNLSSSPQNPGGLTSQCIVAAGATNSVNTTNIEIPYGHSSQFFATSIETFSDVSCSTALREFYFPKGIGFSSDQTSATIVYNVTNYTDLYLRPFDLTSSGSLAFTPGLQGSTNQVLVMTLANEGSETITLNTFTGLSSPYSMTTNCGASLAPSTNCTITVTLNMSSSVGTYNQNLTINYTRGASTISKVVAASAMINQPAFLAITGSNNFGSVPTNTTMTVNFTIMNTGAATANSLSNLPLTPPFSYNGGSYPGTGGTCGTTLGAAASCTVVVQYFSATTYAGGPVNLQLNYNNGVTTTLSSLALMGSSP